MKIGPPTSFDSIPKPEFDVPEMHQIVRDLLQQKGLADFDELCELVKKREGW